jgi:hypothetical protein
MSPNLTNDAATMSMEGMKMFKMLEIMFLLRRM